MPGYKVSRFKDHAAECRALADGWVTQTLRQGDAKVFKRYSQMKCEALEKINRHANEERRVLARLCDEIWMLDSKVFQNQESSKLSGRSAA